MYSFYRTTNKRIGKEGRLTFLFGNDSFTFGDPLLNKAMNIRKHESVESTCDDDRYYFQFGAGSRRF